MGDFIASLYDDDENDAVEKVSRAKTSGGKEKEDSCINAGVIIIHSFLWVADREYWFR